MKPLNRKLIVFATVAALSSSGVAALVGCAAESGSVAVAPITQVNHDGAQPALYADAGPATQPAQVPADARQPSSPALPKGHPSLDELLRGQPQPLAGSPTAPSGSPAGAPIS